MSTRLENESTKNPSKLLTAALTVAVLTASGCGVTQSGFNTDPLAGNGKYKEMQRKGVPQKGAPNQIEKIEIDPVTNQPVQTTDASVPVKQVLPTGSVNQEAPVQTQSEAPPIEIRLAAVPQPETQILNFFESETVVYRVTVEGSEGKASVQNLPKGATFSNLEGSKDVYDIKWTPAKGAAGDDYKLSSLQIKVGEKRTHNLIVNVMKDAGAALIEKITLMPASIKEGDSVLLTVLISTAGESKEAPTVVINAKDKAAAEVEQFVKAAKVLSVKKVEEGLYSAEVVLSSKGVSFKESKVSFFVTATLGQEPSPAIPQIIQVIKAKTEAKTETKSDAKPASKKSAAKTTTGDKK